MDKLDLKKTWKDLYNPSAKEVSVVEVPPFHFLMIDGTGDPNISADYQAAIEALYALSYTLKFAVKKAGTLDYTVMPLEGLWWVEGEAPFTLEDKSAWKWRAMILQPEVINVGLVDEALRQARKKTPSPVLEKVRFEVYAEGLAAQVMHIGPYAAEGPTIEALHRFIAEQGYVPNGKHHEIYLSDPRRTAPEKNRTIIRQPIRKAPR